MAFKSTLRQSLAIFGFMLLFLFVRSGSIEHSARYGSGPHQHDGKLCALSLLAHEDESVAVLPSDPPVAEQITRSLTALNYGQYLLPAQNHGVSVNAAARSPPTV